MILKILLELTEKERFKIMGNRPVSLQELKTKVQQLLVHKSKRIILNKKSILIRPMRLLIRN